MELISDHILEESAQTEPVYPRAYPAVEGFNLGSPGAFTKGQPFTHFKKLRETAPVSWTTMRKGSNGFWSVTRYDDIKAAEVKPQVFSSERGSINMGLPPKHMRFPKKLIPAALNNLINLDAPRHMELRIQQKDFFIPKYVATLRDNVTAKIDSLLDDLEAAEKKSDGGIVDFTKVFSEQLPLYTLCEMLGVDEADRPNIVRWMHYLDMAQQVSAAPWEVIKNDPMFIPRYVKNVKQMFAYGQRVMADRRANPRNDLLTVIAQSTLGGEELPQEYLDGSWLLIIIAGNDTTRNSLSGSMRLLTEFPDQKQMLIDDPTLIPKMSQESLRMVSPVMNMRRTAMEDTELGGQKIAKDEKVIFWYGAANRDPSVFTDPDRFDILRPNADKHLAFGHGPHKCLGSRIANMQLRIAYEKILDRFPDIHWTGEQTITPNNFVHAISSLKVKLRA
ncbi:MAG: cytochrome P450 [Maricaulaceae bacterium]